MTTYPITFRGYRPGDFDALHALDVLCFEPPFRFPRAAMRQFAEASHALVVIAEDALDIVGFCIVHRETRQGVLTGYVTTLDVAPAHRRRGLARLLMQQAEQLAASAGCAVMTLHVFSGNTTAIALYERLGFTQSHIEGGFYGEGRDAFVYRKQLAVTPEDTIN